MAVQRPLRSRRSPRARCCRGAPLCQELAGSVNVRRARQLYTTMRERGTDKCLETFGIVFDLYLLAQDFAAAVGVFKDAQHVCNHSWL